MRPLQLVSKPCSIIINGIRKNVSHVEFMLVSSLDERSYPPDLGLEAICHVYLWHQLQTYQNKARDNKFALG